MLILDSNVWVYVATATTTPVEIYSDYYGTVLKLFEDFCEGNRRTAISAYMMEEVINALERSKRVSGEDQDKALTELFGLIMTCDHIEEDPAISNAANLTLRDVRQRPENQMLAAVLGIQPKDVPILTIAYEYRHQQPHIITDDGDFAEFTPAEWEMSNITIEDANLSW